MIEALVFDLDDTLYLESDFVASGYRAVARHVARKYACRYVDVFYAMMTTFAGVGRNLVFPMVIERFLNPSVSLSELVDVYRRHRPKIGLFPGYSELLANLGRKYRLGVITDGLPAVQRRKVRALGVDEIVDDVIYTWEYGPEREKPHPFSFSLMMDKLCVSPSHAVFVGDNPFKDWAGAHGAGMKFAYVRPAGGDYQRHQQHREPEFLIDSLHQLPSILQHKD